MGKMLGPQQAADILQRMVAFDRSVRNLPHPECVRWVHTLSRVAPESQIPFYVDATATHLGRARSRAFHWAKQVMADNSQCEAWVSVDDDCECNQVATALLLRRLRSDEPRIVCVPFVKRALSKPPSSSIVDANGQPAATMGSPADANIVPELGAQVNAEGLLPIRWGGFGLVGLNRAAVQRYAERCKDQNYLDVDGVERLAVFRDVFHQTEPDKPKEWLTEDYSFFERAPLDVKRYALCEGSSNHGGIHLDLAHLGAYMSGLELQNG